MAPFPEITTGEHGYVNITGRSWLSQPHSRIPNHITGNKYPAGHNKSIPPLPEITTGEHGYVNITGHSCSTTLTTTSDRFTYGYGSIYKVLSTAQC